MEREILYKYAQDADGEVVHIGKAEPRVRYFCPGCKAEFVFRHGQIRQHYFAHKALSPNCTGEGYLHNTFKKLLLGYIKEHIEKNVALVVHARCTICNGAHSCNILGGISNVADEVSLDGCRPDVVLKNASGRIPVIVEIVDTHAPEQNVFDYCAKNTTLLVVVKLESPSDLDNIEGRISDPSTVFFSNAALCPTNMQRLALQRQYTIAPNARTDRRGPMIDQIEATLEKQRYGNQWNHKSQRRRASR